MNFNWAVAPNFGFRRGSAATNCEIYSRPIEITPSASWPLWWPVAKYGTAGSKSCLRVVNMPLTRWMSAVLWFYYMCIIEHDEKRFDIFQFLSFLLNQKLNCSKLFSKGRDKNFVFVRNLIQAKILYCELSQKCHTGILERGVTNSPNDLYIGQIVGMCRFVHWHVPERNCHSFWHQLLFGISRISAM